jgi:biopolymer transport protein ExbD
MRRRLRRRHVHEPPEINITAFMNLMVILVPFLLITAVFSRITILELNLPAAGGQSANQPAEFNLEIIVRQDAIDVGDRNGGLIQRVELQDGGYNFEQLSELLQQVKARYPEKRDATLLLEPAIPYDIVVRTMDSMRMARMVQAGSLVTAELFPVISIGDAPPGQAMKVARKENAG